MAPIDRFEPEVPAAAAEIPLCVPEIRGNEWRYIKECLDTNFVSSVGPFVLRFERAVADLVGAEHAVATVNGTAALHVALLVAGVKPDDEVLVSTLTFIAPVNAIRYVHAWPVLIDAEPAYWQMDPEKLKDFLANRCEWKNSELLNRQTGRRVCAILPVHILGHPVNMDPIVDLARQYHLSVIEDATESLGSTYNGRMVGTLGDIACFSFNGNKLVTTGGGGMIVTNHESSAIRAKYLTTQAKDEPIEFVHNAVGFNYRLTNIQAALGCAQLENLDEYVVSKRRIAHSYAHSFRGMPGLTFMKEAPWARGTFWLSTVLIDEKAFGISSRDLLRYMGRHGIQCRPLWQPMHHSPAHLGMQQTDCSVADRLNRQALSLPSSVGLRSDEQARVIETIINAAATVRHGS